MQPKLRCFQTAALTEFNWTLQILNLPDDFQKGLNRRPNLGNALISNTKMFQPNKAKLTEMWDTMQCVYCLLEIRTSHMVVKS